MALNHPCMVEIMEFLVLGPLRVEDGGARLELGGPKQRTLLALLIASAGRQVATDALLMGTHGPDADPRSRRSIQTWVSGYRRTFGPIIESRAGGYLLDVDPRTIDAHRFENHIALSRTMRSDEAAAELLREALGLWRGSPYGDVESVDALRAEALRLEALWSEALDARIRLDLDAGRHRQLVPELETLVAAHPHHENLQAHHMVALYRCGRQADALRAFRVTEDLLREELGVDPSPELRDLERRILQQDHALDYRPTARMRRIPARYTSFLGRSGEVAQIGQLLRAHRLVTITGPGGIGKSSLGVEVARSLSQEFPSAYVPIESNRDVPVWNVVAASLGLQGQDQLADRSKRLIGDGSVLVILDGCEHVLDAVAEVTAELLTGCPNVRILVTSREPLAATGERVVTVGPLGDGDGSAANQLFLDRAGLDGIVDEASLSLVTTIGRRLAGLPLGLELAAARARTMSLEEITARLDDQPSLLQTKRGVVPHQRSIIAALDWSYDILDPNSQRVFRLLGAFPTGSISLAGAGAVLDMERPEEVLRPLVDASIITRSADDPGGYLILEPIRQYAEMKLESSGELEDARLRLGEWIARLCLQVHLDYLSGDLFTSTRTLRRHWPAIATTASWAVESGHPEVTLAIIAGAGRRWPHVADPDVLIAPGIAALDAPGTVGTDIRLRALAHLAYLHTPQRPDEALRLLEQMEAETRAVEDVDLITDQIVESIRSAVPYRAARGIFMPPETREEGLRALDRSIDLVSAMGYPIEPHLYNRALSLELRGDVEESRRHLDRLAAWAGEDRPVWRAMALHTIAKRQALDGDPQAGLASAAEAARLLVDADDLDFAAEAEFILSHISAEAEHFDAAQESIERIDFYHRQVGLDPVAIEEPDLDAEVAAGLSDWSRFINSATRFIHEIPGPEVPDARAYFLEGEPGNTSRVARMVPPTVRYLAANGARNAASRLAAAMPNLARMSTSPDVFETSGLLGRTARLADELDLPIPSNAPSSPEEVFEAIRRAISTDGASRD